MNQKDIEEIIQRQKAFYETGATLPVEKRIEALRRLYSTIRMHEAEILSALQADLGKSAQESFMCEVGLVLSELSYMIAHVRKFARRKTVRTPLAQWFSHSFTQASPYGTALIMSPWNYPFLLTLGPLSNAIAAGNTAVIKPSAYSPETGKAIKRLIEACFDEAYVAVVSGGREENASLLKAPFDYIFFTGSQNVGREVLHCAAERLTPVTLELGGKSPCMVDDSAKIALAAKRIVFGKFLNCGQTCVAPDYIYCDEKIKDALLSEMILQIKAQFGESPLQNPNYGNIINRKHFVRLKGLMEGQKIAFGGRTDESMLKIEPTLIDEADWNAAVMQEEIFGPLLPFLTFRSPDEAIQKVNTLPHPLALYIFSENRQVIDQVMNRCAFGGGCINDTVIHLATSEMGFGGVGASGMGACHGKIGFETFSHQKSIVDKKTWFDLPMRYQPYNQLNDKLIRLFLR